MPSSKISKNITRAVNQLRVAMGDHTIAQILSAWRRDNPTAVRAADRLQSVLSQTKRLTKLKAYPS
jgi:hypothetical protein